MTILSHPNELSRVREGGHDLCGDKHSSMGLTKKALWPVADGRHFYVISIFGHFLLPGYLDDHDEKHAEIHFLPFLANVVFLT